jgi:oligopeptide/dipeptide ABC transporter ATP-binding protein
VVFQNSHGSLDPRLTVGDSIAEPLGALLGLSGRDCRERARELLASVGLPAHLADRRPGELSGGQLQRIAIARAIAVDPELLVADEPTSALDVSVQAQVMNLLIELRQRLKLTYLFITHNLSLVLAVADRVGVMYLGALVEIAPAEVLAAGPAHPYSAMLLRSNPDPDSDGFDPHEVPADTVASGELWDGVGCRFRSRCPQRQDRCAVEAPVSRRLSAGHHVSCHYPLSTPQPVAVSSTPYRQASGS